MGCNRCGGITRFMVSGAWNFEPLSPADRRATGVVVRVHVSAARRAASSMPASSSCELCGRRSIVPHPKGLNLGKKRGLAVNVDKHVLNSDIA